MRWRRADLARRIEAEFNVKLHKRKVSTYLARLGFRKLSVRPEHPNAHPAAQAAFKKLCKHCS
ncbi:winged helix-turn-helix domain-containing protein [Planktotalea sp.]|uniref:helix-turn-helix domain-containing protein n=1 Tax=Planktotalea sp. TaxID=2029877 RepID=UPI0035C831BF